MIRRSSLIAIVVIVSAAASVSYGYINRVHRPFRAERLTLHDEIVSGSADSPYRYRILSPAIGEMLTRMVATRLPRETAFLVAFAIHDLVAITFLLGALYSWLRIWFQRDQALVGVLFVAATMPMALKDHYYQPWSVVEAALFCIALQAMWAMNTRRLFVVTALASLNRETALVIPAALLLISVPARGRPQAEERVDPRRIVTIGALFALSLSILLILRAARGASPHTLSLEELLARNVAIGGLWRTIVNCGLLFGGFWIFAAAGLRDAPPFLRKSARIVPLYLAAILPWGVWSEARLLMPLYPIVVALGLSFICAARERPRREGGLASSQ